MANIKITDLTAYTAPETTDVIPIVDVTTDTTKKVAVGEVVGKNAGDVDVATDGTSSITAGAIVDADVNASAAIAGTKIAPDFGSQTIETTGDINSGRLLVGTSSWSGNNSRLVCAGNTGNASGVGLIAAARGDVSANLSLNSEIGRYVFADLNGAEFARIACFVDATPGAIDDHPGRLVFSTTADGAASPTEAMRIANDGRILFGTTVATIASNSGITLVPSTNGRMVLDIGTTTTGSSQLQRFFNGNGQVGSISTDGTATAYNTSSDYRLKENIVPVADGISRLQQLKPSRFNFITDPDTTVDGFIAHEVQDVVPEAIAGEKDAVDDEGNPEYQGIDQSKLVPLLTAALQEAVAKIETLEARVAALEAN